MPITIQISAPMEEFWADEETLNELSDKEVLELVREDITALLEKAKWAVVRSPRLLPSSIH